MNGWLLALASGALAALAIPALGRFASHWGLMDLAGGRKAHQGEVPLVGGLGIAFALTGVWTGGRLLGSVPFPGSVLAWLMACSFVGLLDDGGGKTMTASTKASATGLLLLLAALPLDGSDGFWLPVGFLVLHSLNTSDNTHGLAGGLALVVALGVAVGSPLGLGDRTLATALAAALLVFLRFNFPTGRVFLGDAGSLLLGGWFATVMLRAQHPGTLCLAAVPLGDLLVTAWIRLRVGQHPWVGDRRHASHRLAGQGMGARNAVIWLVLVQAACTVAGLLLWAGTSPSSLVAWAGSLSVMLVPVVWFLALPVDEATSGREK